MGNFESGPEKINKKIILEIETELLRRAGCVTEDNEKSREWIDAYAEAFRILAESDSALLDVWQKDPEATLRDIENRLYREKGRESKA